MNRSASLGALVPSGVVTPTATVPVPGGAVAVIWVGPSTRKPVAGTEPKATAVAPVSAVPVIVTAVPPAAGPLGGLSAVTAGGVTAA